MKSNNSLLLRLVILLFVFLASVGGVSLWWQDATDAVDPKDSTPVIFTVGRGEGIKSLATRLAQQQLVRSPTGFFLYIRLSKLDNRIQAGDFRLTKAMNAKQIAEELMHGVIDIWVTTLEGWRVDEIATKLSRELAIPEQEFLKYAKEGYMFPDTYLVPRDATAGAVVKLFLSTFDAKVTPQLRADSAKTGLSLDQVITLASIVEREGKNDDDRPMIAGILLKRMKSDWPLEIDATLQYALGYQSNEKTWWKRTLYNEDKLIVSPYNTYKHKGLPPGPIGNPGLSSIKAVIYAKPSEYWFYLHDDRGVVHYGRTLEEHTANIETYLAH